MRVPVLPEKKPLTVSKEEKVFTKWRLELTMESQRFHVDRKTAFVTPPPPHSGDYLSNPSNSFYTRLYICWTTEVNLKAVPKDLPKRKCFLFDCTQVLLEVISVCLESEFTWRNLITTLWPQSLYEIDIGEISGIVHSHHHWQEHCIRQIKMKSPVFKFSGSTRCTKRISCTGAA